MHRGVDTAPARAETLPAETMIGAVRLTVSDLPRAVAFYERVLGLRAMSREDGTVSLQTGPGRTLIELRGDSSGSPRDPGAPGLYHLAVLMPDRPALAGALARVINARWPLSGASDHLVSEALYLADPDGNGIEIYRDRPREEWPVRDGTLAMDTLPLDLENLLTELDGSKAADPMAPEDTRMGHVHLQVGDLRAAEDFYVGVLGFEVTVRSYPGALFVAAGGYHHHVGLNTWRSAGSPPATPESIGLRSFEVVVPSADALDRILARVRAVGFADEPADIDDGILVHDPSGNGVLLRAG